MTQESNQPQDAARDPAPGEAAGEAREGAGAAASETDVESLQQALDRAREEAQAHHERYLREAAELQNLRKRSVEREEKARKFAVDRFAGDLLNVKDSLEMGLAAAASEPTVESLREGMEATLRQLEQAFATAGLAELNPPEGEPFDPRHHEAMAMQEIAGLEHEKVLAVIQKGYQLHERVLRPARVMVGKPAPKADADDPAESAPS